MANKPHRIIEEDRLFRAMKGLPGLHRITDEELRVVARDLIRLSRQRA